MKISRRKFLQVTGLAAGASMLPLPVKFLGAGKAEAFYQTTGVPLFGTTLRLAEIPVAIPNPLAGEGAVNDVVGTFPVGFPKYFLPGTGAPVTGVRHYTFGLNQFQDPGVVPTLGPTTLWGYKPSLTLLEGLTALGAIPNASGAPLAGLSVAPGTQPQRQLGGIMLVESYQPVQITMVNNLELNGIIPNDLTIPGADQGADRTCVHFHGGLVPWISDGGPFDWFCSTKRPLAQQACGSSFINNIVLNPAAAASKTQAEYYWPNQQSARFGWFHDHAFGITRLNAYAGVATGQVFRDDFERNLVTLGMPPLLENSLLNLMGLNAASGLKYAPVREYPIVVQDKIFISKCAGGIKAMDPSWPATCPQTPGSLWYPHIYERARWRRNYSALALPNPSVIAEMFGDTILCNGTAYPTLTVEPRRYRFRMLNAQNARFLNMQLYYAYPDTGVLAANETRGGGIVVDKVTGIVNTVKCPPFNDGTVSGMLVPATNTDARLTAGLPYGPGWITQIGCETGFLPTVVAANVATQATVTAVANPNLSRQEDIALLIGCAERPDIIVDFSLSAGKTVVLYSDAPGPFPGGDVRNDYFPGLQNGNVVNTTTKSSVGPNSRIQMRFVVGKKVTGAPDGPTQVVPGLSLSGIAPVNNCPWNSEGQLATVNPDGTFVPSVPVNRTLQFGLYEGFDAYGRLEQFVGPVTTGPIIYDTSALAPEELHLQDDVEIWEVYNTTADTHPMHWHLFNAQLLNRQAFAAPGDGGVGPVRGPLSDEFGFKETIKCWPGEIVRFIVKVGVPAIKKFDGTTVLCPTSPRGIPANAPLDVYNTNEYVWHCHILEHEEHDMMRPLCVSPIAGINAPPTPAPV